MATDLAVDLKEDRPGMLARAAAAIASGGLNLDGFAEIEGALHVLTSDPRAARLALDSVGLQVIEDRKVVVVKLENRPGSAAAVFSRLAEAGVNVAYTYLGASDRVIIAADDVDAAMAALRAPARA